MHFNVGAMTKWSIFGIFFQIDPSYLNTYDELVENFLHVCSP